MLSFRQLQYLVAIADYQHFRRAAANLHVSQPTLSLQVQKMEEHLGVALVERGVTPVRLTPVGREIVARARSHACRRYDRRTSVLAIGFPSAAYQASADLLIDERLFVEQALGAPVEDGEERQDQPQHGRGEQRTPRAAARRSDGKSCQVKNVRTAERRR